MIQPLNKVLAKRTYRRFAQEEITLLPAWLLERLRETSQIHTACAEARADQLVLLEASNKLMRFGIWI